MSYVIFKTDGTVLTTIADGTINTTSTPLSLPGRLYAGYGQVIDTNVVHLLENFADVNPPPNALEGQLWYDIGNSILYICPSDGEANFLNWIPITSTMPGANTQFGNIDANNLNLTNTLTANLVDTDYLTVNIQANIANANVTGNANIANLTTANITTGASTTQGNLTGAFTVTGSATLNSNAGTAMWVTGGNLLTAGIKSDNWYYANGVVISFDGTYTNSNVAAYLPTYSGNVGAPSSGTTFNGNTLSTGANTTSGAIIGAWALSPGSTLTGLTNIDAANIVGSVPSALTAGTVTTAAQPNITSVGTLTGLGVNGVVSAIRFVSNVATGTQPLTVSSSTKVANLNADLLDGYDTDTAATGSTVVVRDSSGNVSANYIIGNGALITGLNAGAVAQISNGSSNVAAIASGGNVTIGIGGLSNLAVFSSSGLAIIGNVSASNVSATRLTGALTTAAQPNVTSLGTLTSLGVNGTITAVNFTANTGTFSGNGAGLTNIPAANIVGTVSSATTATTATSATTAGTVTTAAQPNITSVGTLTSINSSGNVTAGNVYANSGTVGASLLIGTLTTAAQPNITSVGTITGLTSTGNITAPNFIGNIVGNIIGNIVVPGSNTQVLYNNDGQAGASAGFTFNQSSGLVTLSGNVQASRFIGSGANLTSIPGANVTGTVANATFATSAGTATSATSAGTATSATSATTAGTVTTAAQPNITSVGTLTGLTVAGNISAGNVNATHLGSGSGLTNLPGANVTGTVANATYATTAGSAGTASSATTAGTATSADSATTAGTVTTAAQPNITSVGTLSSLGVSGNVQASRFIGSGANLTSINGANVTGTVANATFATSAGSASTADSATTAGSATSAGSATTATRAGTVTTAAQPNITSVGTMTFLTVNGNLNAVNLIGNGAGLTNVPGTIPSGTRMLFAQTSAPTGWTKQTSNDNAALRVVSGSAGSGGSVNFTSAFTAQAVSGTIGGTSLTEAQMPSHRHLSGVIDDSPNTIFNQGAAGPSYVGPNGPDGNNNDSYYAGYTDYVGGGQTHTHTFSGTAIDLAVKYVDVIIAQKD